MNRRVAGVVALFALLLSYSGAVAAALCDFGMEMDSGAVVGQAAGSSHAMPMPAGAPSKTPSPTCPYSTPGSTAACIFSIALPGQVTTAVTFASVRSTFLPFRHQSHQLLLSHSLFHPPKA